MPARPNDPTTGRGRQICGTIPVAMHERLRAIAVEEGVNIGVVLARYIATGMEKGSKKPVCRHEKVSKSASGIEVCSGCGATRPPGKSWRAP